MRKKLADGRRVFRRSAPRGRLERSVIAMVISPYCVCASSVCCTVSPDVFHTAYSCIAHGRLTTAHERLQLCAQHTARFPLASARVCADVLQESAPRRVLTDLHSEELTHLSFTRSPQLFLTCWLFHRSTPTRPRPPQTIPRPPLPLPVHACTEPQPLTPHGPSMRSSHRGVNT